MAQTSLPSQSAPHGDEQPPRVGAGVAIAVVLALVATMLGIFAVGHSLSLDAPVTPTVDPAGDPAATEAVPATTVDLTEFAITPSTDTVAEGAVLEVTNSGAAPHNVAVRGTDVRVAELQPGESAPLDVSSLPPGDYEWLCEVAGHEGAGMAGAFTIVPAADHDAMSAQVDALAADDGAEGHDAGSGYLTREEADAKEAAMMASLAAFPAETAAHGAQRLEPSEITADGTKVFELTVDEVDWEVEPGKVVKAMAYNGMIPGPTIQVDLGDSYVIRVTNELDNESTTLHPHGVNGHLVQYDGVAPITQEPIRTGESYDYEFEATEPSLGMYHSHHHALHQIPDGLAGAIIVGDYAELTGEEGITQEHVMMLNDAGVIGFSLDGKSFPATRPHVAQVGERMMVHYMNEGVMSHPMHLHGQTGWVVAKDGFPLPQPYRADTINVAPGERYTVVYDVEQVGTWVWHCHILSHVKRTDGSMFGMLTALVVEDPETGSTAGGDL